MLYDKNPAADLLHDRMTQKFNCKAPDLDLMFARGIPTPSETIPMHVKGSNPREVLRHANRTLRLALGEPEIESLVEAYSMDGPIARDPTETELFHVVSFHGAHTPSLCFQTKSGIYQLTTAMPRTYGSS